MTIDRERLLSLLDELVVDIKSLEDSDALHEVVGYIARVVTAVWPEPMPDDVADAIEAEVTSADDPAEHRLQRRQERNTDLLGPGLRLAHLVLRGDDRSRAAEFGWGLVALAEGRDDPKINAAVEELRATLRKAGGDD